MEHLPVYINIFFILITLFTVLMLYKASNYSKPVLIISLLWLALQAVVGLSGFYTVTIGVPPRFALLLMPPVVFIAVLFFLKKGLKTIDGFDVKILIMLHVVRILVEFTLYWLYLYKMVPEIMTFEGRNFDIFCGLTAPLIYYFGYVKKVLNNKVLLAWNILCLLLLANIAVTAVLSAPFSVQKFGFDQPNIALFYFPFVWLPCYIVPVVFLAHLITIRRLIKR